MGYRMAKMILFGRVKNGILGFCDFLSKRAQSQACLSYAERRQKSWAQHIKNEIEKKAVLFSHTMRLLYFI